MKTNSIITPAVQFLIDMYCLGRLTVSNKGPANDVIHWYNNPEKQSISISPEEEYLFRKIVSGEQTAKSFIVMWFPNFFN